jgi:hypothetical protein
MFDLWFSIAKNYMVSVAYFVVEGWLKWGTSRIIGGLSGIIRRLCSIGKRVIACQLPHFWSRKIVVAQFDVKSGCRHLYS